MSPIGITYGSLLLIEPTGAEVAAHAEQLSGWYSHPDNMRLMTSDEPMTPAEVMEWFREGRASGDRLFLIFYEGSLIGDADFRNIRGTTAEFAIMIGPAGLQGKGIGTTTAAALHHLAFLHLGLRRVILSVSKGNDGAVALYRKLGYEPDGSPEAAACADHPDDVTMSVPAERFYKRFPDIGSMVSIVERQI